MRTKGSFLERALCFCVAATALLMNELILFDMLEYVLTISVVMVFFSIWVYLSEFLYLR